MQKYGKIFLMILLCMMIGNGAYAADVQENRAPDNTKPTSLLSQAIEVMRQKNKNKFNGSVKSRHGIAEKCPDERKEEKINSKLVFRLDSDGVVQEQELSKQFTKEDDFNARNWWMQKLMLEK